MKVLFVIDVQPVFLTSNKLKKLPSKILKHINLNNYDYIFSFGFLNKVNSPFMRFWKWEKCFKGSLESQLFDSIVKKSNFVIWKNEFSCYNQELEEKLEQINFNPSIDKIYLCGLDTNVCVLATCLDLFINNYDIYLLPKLCGSDKGNLYHRAGIKIIEHILGKNKIKNSKKHKCSFFI